LLKNTRRNLVDNNTLNTILWIAQILVGAMFLMAGLAKATQPREKLAAQMGWVNDFSAGQVKTIGILEILGGIGVIVPALTGILPILTPIAATGLIIIQLGAAYTHYRRGEMPMIGINTVLILLAAFVAYGRFALVPLS
jgi:uncharacterized membrane protein YphA (DoxX/SURF4 family)